MQQQLFMFKDNIAGTFDFPILSVNVGLLKRQVKGLLLTKRLNPNANIAVLDHLDDKDIYAVATIDTESGVVKALDSPIFIFHLTQLDDEVLQDIATYNQRLKNAGFDEKVEGVTNDKSEEEEKA